MNVTRDVITDLLPVYFSGEASDDTCALVEDFFRADPHFVAMAREEWSPAGGPQQDLKQEAQMETLNRTKQLLRNRSLFLSVAIFFSLLPFFLPLHRKDAVLGVAGDAGACIRGRGDRLAGLVGLRVDVVPRTEQRLVT